MEISICCNIPKNLEAYLLLSIATVRWWSREDFPAIFKTCQASVEWTQLEVSREMNQLWTRRQVCRSFSKGWRRNVVVRPLQKIVFTRITKEQFLKVLHGDNLIIFVESLNQSLWASYFGASNFIFIFWKIFDIFSVAPAKWYNILIRMSFDAHWRKAFEILATFWRYSFNISV